MNWNVRLVRGPLSRRVVLEVSGGEDERGGRGRKVGLFLNQPRS